jgi:hypothetical protein
MASKKTLNVSNLEVLGAKRLAELLIETSAGNAAAKRRLRLELAGASGPEEATKEIQKRLATIARSRSFIDWQNRKALLDDLETQRRAIVEQVAKADPIVGLDLMWRFMALANSIFERCDDSSGKVIDVFHSAAGDLGEIAQIAKVEPKSLAEQAFRALNENGYGQYDSLIKILAPVLGKPGLAYLKQLIVALSQERPSKPNKKDRVEVGWGSGGAIYADDLEESRRKSTVRHALMEIADAEGDVDAFISQYSEEQRTFPRIASKIVERLIAAGRLEEAWDVVTAAKDSDRDWPDFDLDNARIAVLEALGRTGEAQAVRWSCFERALSSSHLRAYLERLPDFEDVETEQRALDYAMNYPSFLQALFFFVRWPAIDRAAELVTKRADKLDGDRYEVLTPAAEALAGKYPLAATLVLRAMIDFSLSNGRSSRYRHAARHFADCSGLASSIKDFGPFGDHEAYAARLRSEHGKKSSFWSLIN